MRRFTESRIFPSTHVDHLHVEADGEKLTVTLYGPATFSRPLPRVAEVFDVGLVPRRPQHAAPDRDVAAIWQTLYRLRDQIERAINASR